MYSYRNTLLLHEQLHNYFCGVGDRCAETKRILMAAKYLKAQATQSTNPELPSDYTPTPEDLATLQYWQDRFKAQLKKPEPEAPIDPDTGRHKTYFRFDAFIRTCLLREMK